MIHKVSESLTALNGRSVILSLLLLCALPFPAPAQQGVNSKPGRLAKIEFKGLERLKEEQAAAASGLKIGEMVDVPAVEAASQSLIDSGLFKKLGYRYHEDKGQVTVTFTVEEANAGVPVVFDNFIWFSDEELLNAIRRDVPTFDGTAPESGTLADQIARALERLLKEKNIQGHVEYKPSADLSGRNAKQVFSVTGVPLPLCSVSFPGADGIAESELVKNSKPLMANDYSQEFVAEFAKSNLIPLYLRKGHLRAKFLSPSAKPEINKICQNGVAAAIPVEEGLVYSLNKVDWVGNSALNAAELESVLGMRAGEVADGVKFIEGMSAVRDAYGKHGYLALKLKPEPDFDDAGRRVSYRISVTEGPQFRMGSLVVNGLSESDAGKLKARWKLQPGEVYDASYLKEFMKRGIAEVRSTLSSGRKGLEVDEKPNKQNLTVDVILNFK
jgi:outer membrane protein assembly factor BamA